MKKLLDHIHNDPPLVLVMLGINLEAFQCLTAQVEKAHLANRRRKPNVLLFP
jgi:hypothetical protein